jgi:LmbE family N-acetylglucosaminyl deacetylase
VTGSPTAVTPAGHELEHWQQQRSRARTVDLTDLLDLLHLGTVAGPRLVVVGAHPDDETLGLGRLIHRWARTLGPVTAVVSTAGEACVDHVLTRPDGLAERRLAEWHRAMAVLGVEGTYALGLADGTLAGAEPVLTSALEDVLADLSARDGRSCAGAPVLLACPWRGDPHPDHQAVGRVVGALALQRGLPHLEFPVWMTYWSEPAELTDDGRTLVSLTTDADDQDAHRRACTAFRSPLVPIAPGLGPVVPAQMLAHHHEQLVIMPSERLAP